MEKTIAVFAIFTFLLFSVTTAQIALGQIGSESSTESVTVAEKPKSELDQTVTNDRTIDLSTIDQTPRLRFARSRAIKRHSFDKTARIPLRFVRHQPCRKFQNKFMLPRTERSYGNDMIVSSKTYSFDTKAIGDQVPTEWLEFKHRLLLSTSVVLEGSGQQCWSSAVLQYSNYSPADL
ncbi:hypothetical protein LXL04_007394 [Taraxacum kok-saghyz]